MTVERLPPVRIEEEVDRRHRTVALGDDDALLDVLSSRTAREIVAVVRESPATTSAIAEELDVSIQAVTYHLDRLESAGVLAPVGTKYSPKGREMRLYTLSTGSVTISLSGEGM
jgi:predicted transcriptional regulator